MEFNQAYDPFRALSSSWKALAQAPLPLLIGGVILLLTQGGTGGFQGNPSNIHGGMHDVDWHRIAPFVLAFIGFACCVGIVCFLLSSWVMVGYANTVEEVLRTGKGELGRVFDAKGRFVSMVLARLLCIVVAIAAALPFIVFIVAGAMVSSGFHVHVLFALLIVIPGCLAYLFVYLYIVLGLTLADQAVALDGLQPVESIQRSWSLVSGNRLMMFWFWLATGIFTALGFCLCCIGIFLTGTMAQIARSESYLALTRGGERSGWWIEKGFAPPPPPQGWGAPSPPSA
jgi:hypothetical protein